MFCTEADAALHEVSSVVRGADKEIGSVQPEEAAHARSQC
ncbi:MAG: hypothetical protein QOI35_950, partial [Cryptosporangiaceae bacterium]|nr:hypothetical protein [Cryptosporangiaceae bacterium]